MSKPKIIQSAENFPLLSVVVPVYKEELNIETKGSCLAPLSFASHQYEKFHLLMPLFICRRWWGNILALESQEVLWVWPKKLRDFDMPPADEPLVSMLRDFL